MAVTTLPKVSIAYDSVALKGFEAGWGFSAVLTGAGRIVLFDCGWDGHLLRRNLGRLGYSFADIGTVVLSHAHWDHIGGLPELLQDLVLDQDLRVVLHEGFSQNLRSEIKKKATVIEVEGPQEVAPGIWSTGVLGKEVKEQALMVPMGSRGLVVTGCAHPGVENILKRASELGTPTSVIGGFHGAALSEFPSTLEKLVICHCTKMKDELLERFASKASVGMVGASYDFAP
jgi:7,8-dihydropterin-6-yl-methyl-4-(beta-D-ribofuranosyl)aminobenzene 5'-phosphate synthase